MSHALALLVIGGGPAGLAAARGYRDAGGRGAVAIVSDEYRTPYERPPLTKAFLRGHVGEDELDLEPEEWFGENGVALISGRAVALDAAAHELVLAHLPANGGTVAVIGSGFIGCEIAASLRRRGSNVVLISDGELLSTSGVQLEHGAVPTDASMRTALADVLAAGEASAWDQVPGFWSTIGDRTLKYAAWGDGYDETRFERGDDGAFTAWYGRGGRVVGVLTHDTDADYERGRTLIAEAAPWA